MGETGFLDACRLLIKKVCLSAPDLPALGFALVDGLLGAGHVLPVQPSRGSSWARQSRPVSSRWFHTFVARIL